MILESNLHKSALRKLDGGDRRGRPDIVHFFLLLALDSVPNKKHLLRTMVHTRNDQIISIEPETRIPRNYNRFIGLMEDLFKRRAVPPKEPLLTIRDNVGLKDILDELKPDVTVALSPRGESADPKVLFAGLMEHDHVAVIIGGFPEGDFISPAEEMADRTVSIFPEELTVWTVASEVLANFGH
jgi:rRNA small subunit pseudouridine methyltransferase Nep1